MKVLVTFFSFVAFTCSVVVSELQVNVSKTKQFMSGTLLRSCNTYSNTNFIWKSQRDKAGRSVEVEKEAEAVAEERTLSLTQTDLCLAYENENDTSKTGQCFMNSACLINNYEYDLSYNVAVDSDFKCCYIRTSFANLHSGISTLNRWYDCDGSDQCQNYWLQKQCKALCDVAVPSFFQNTWYPNLCQNPFNPNMFDQCVCQIAELG